MSRFPAIILFFILIATVSCDQGEKVTPDIETSFPQTFKIKIFANQGVSDAKIVDITSSKEYNNFKSNIGGFELRRLTYQFRNTNVPDDMMFSGTVICGNEENTEYYTLGTIADANLTSLSSSGAEYDLNYSEGNIDKVLSWLTSPGRFKLKSEYRIVGADGNPYLIDGMNAGSNFELQIKLYVTVKSKK
jgi:hypothetical protein